MTKLPDEDMIYKEGDLLQTPGGYMYLVEGMFNDNYILQALDGGYTFVSHREAVEALEVVPTVKRLLVKL